jgi:hypothetical protein
MKSTLTLLATLLPLAALHAADSTDPFAPYLDGKAPEILREVASTNAPPENITVRRVVFRSRENSEIFAVIATPKNIRQASGHARVARRRHCGS